MEIICSECNTPLEGSWTISKESKNSLHLSLPFSFFLSLQPNEINSYCSKCYPQILKQQGDSKLLQESNNTSSELTNLKNLTASLKESNQKLTSTTQLLENKLNSLETEKNNLLATNKQQKDMISNYQESENNLSAKIDKLTTENNRLENNNITMERNYNTMLNESNSHDVTVKNLDEVIANLQKTIESLKFDLKVTSDNKSNVDFELINAKNNIMKLGKEIETLTQKSDNLRLEIMKNAKINLDEDKFYDSKFYDVVIDIENLNELPTSGWKLSLSEEGKKRNQCPESTVVVGVIGNFNMCKSHTLKKISDYEVPAGYSIQTKGLSIKYPKNLDQSITTLDSAGFNTAIKILSDECGNLTLDEINDRSCQIAGDK